MSLRMNQIGKRRSYYDSWLAFPNLVVTPGVKIYYNFDENDLITNTHGHNHGEGWIDAADYMFVMNACKRDQRWGSN